MPHGEVGTPVPPRRSVVPARPRAAAGLGAPGEAAALAPRLCPWKEPCPPHGPYSPGRPGCTRRARRPSPGREAWSRPGTVIAGASGSIGSVLGGRPIGPPGSRLTSPEGTGNPHGRPGGGWDRPQALVVWVGPPHGGTRGLAGRDGTVSAARRAAARRRRRPRCSAPWTRPHPILERKRASSPCAAALTLAQPGAARRTLALAVIPRMRSDSLEVTRPDAACRGDHGQVAGLEDGRPAVRNGERAMAIGTQLEGIGRGAGRGRAGSACPRRAAHTGAAPRRAADRGRWRPPRRAPVGRGPRMPTLRIAAAPPGLRPPALARRPTVGRAHRAPLDGPRPVRHTDIEAGIIRARAGRSRRSGRAASASRRPPCPLRNCIGRSGTGRRGAQAGRPSRGRGSARSASPGAAPSRSRGGRRESRPGPRRARRGWCPREGPEAVVGGATWPASGRDHHPRASRPGPAAPQAAWEAKAAGGDPFTGWATPAPWRPIETREAACPRWPWTPFDGLAFAARLVQKALLPARGHR